MRKQLSAVLAVLVCLSCTRGTGPVAPAPQVVTVEGADGFGARTLQFSSLSSSEILPIQAQGDWHVYLPSSCDWVEVSPSAGSSGPVDLTVTVKANPTFAQRKAQLSFVAEGIEQKALVTILQNRLYYIETTLLSPVMGKGGGQFDIAVNCNGGWRYTLDEEGQAWLTETKVDSDRLVLTAQPMTGSANHGVITFICRADEAIRTQVEVWQKDIGLAIAGKELKAGQEGVEVTIPVVRTNLETWKVESAPDWVTAAGGPDALQVKIAANPTGQARQGTLVLGTDEDREVTAALVVRQLGEAAPKADLADIVFHADDSAEDVASGLKVTLKPGDVHVVMDEEYGVYAPVFSHTVGSVISSGYYEFPMSSDFIAALDDDGCAIEAVVKAGLPLEGVGTKPFSAHRSGGIGFGVASASSNEQFLFFLGQRINGSLLNNYAYSGFIPKAGVYYHLLGVWDKQTGTGTLYVDSQPTGTVTLVGDLYFLTKHFLIGGAPNDTSASKAAAAWNGEVLFPRVYSKPLTPGQVEAAFLATRKGGYILTTD